VTGTLVRKTSILIRVISTILPITEERRL
jgi:hypothetical protein